MSEDEFTRFVHYATQVWNVLSVERNALPEYWQGYVEGFTIACDLFNNLLAEDGEIFHQQYGLEYYDTPELRYDEGIVAVQRYQDEAMRKFDFTEPAIEGFMDAKYFLLSGAIEYGDLV